MAISSRNLAPQMFSHWYEWPSPVLSLAAALAALLDSGSYIGGDVFSKIFNNIVVLLESLLQDLLVKEE